MPLFPGQIIRIGDEDKMTLAGQLGEIIDDLEEQSNPLFRAMVIWRKNYEAEPRSKEKNFPFRNSSNVVVPLIKIMSDSLASRSMSLMFGRGKRIIAATTENDSNKSMASNIARGFNWAAQGNEFHFMPIIYDWFNELFPMGTSVMAINYRRDIKPVFFGAGTPGRQPKHDMVEFTRGVNYEFSPREDYLWDTNFEVGDAPVVVRQHGFDWSTLNGLAFFDKSWDDEALEAIRGHGGDDTGTPRDQLKHGKDATDGRTPVEFGDRSGPHDIREIWVDWPILGTMGFQRFGDEDLGTPNLPLQIHYHRKTRTILRIVANPYHLSHKPFFDGFFRKKSGRGHSTGVAKALEMLQSAQTTLFNQAIDSRTRSNAIWAKTRNPRHLRDPIDPSKPILVSDMAELEFLNIPTTEFSDLSLMTAANTIAERLIGQNDPGLGRETRHGGHPSPATTTLALLEQSGQVSAGTDMLIRAKISKMAEAWAVLTQQFETNEDGKLQRTFGDMDAAAMEQFLFPTEPIPGNYQFDLVAMNETLNPDTEMQRAVTVAGMINNYWSFVLRGIQAMENPQVGPLLKKGWTQAIESATSIYAKFLEAADVDDMEKFLAKLNDFGPDSAAGIRDFAGGARELAAGAGAVQPPGNGGIAPGAPGGANGADAARGVLNIQ